MCSLKLDRGCHSASELVKQSFNADNHLVILDAFLLFQLFSQRSHLPQTIGHPPSRLYFLLFAIQPKPVLVKPSFCSNSRLASQMILGQGNAQRRIGRQDEL